MRRDADYTEFNDWKDLNVHSAQSIYFHLMHFYD